MRFALALALVAALALVVGSPVCCAFGDCCEDVVAEQPADASCCCCEEEQEQPQPHQPDCECQQKDQPLHAAAHAPAFDHDTGPLVALLYDELVAPATAHAVATERTRAPPRTAHAAVSLPLLL
ncbi:MAG: hypothetical protein ACYTGN_11335 [Planctomycetota bacterium]|jgi:hypothetical protein